MKNRLLAASRERQSNTLAPHFLVTTLQIIPPIRDWPVQAWLWLSCWLRCVRVVRSGMPLVVEEGTTTPF